MKSNEPEQLRLVELKSYCILDTPKEKDFDEITELIASICEVPIATITFIDESREWFKAGLGLKENENARNIAFCARTIYSDDIYIVQDASLDHDFSSNPMVINAPHIRFYAGVPLISPNGLALGALAVKDTKPRILNALQIQSLKTLANQVMTQLELRRQGLNLERLSVQRNEINNQLVLQTEHLENEREFLRAIFNQSYLFQGLMKADGEVIDINESALKNCGYLRDAEIGKKFWDTGWWNKDPKISLYIHEVVERGQAGEIVHASTDYHTANGNLRKTEFILTPIKNKEGKVTHLLASGQDVTERKNSELALAGVNKGLRLLSSFKELLISEKNETGLLAKACELIVKAGGYEMACVGYLSNDHDDNIKPISYFGNKHQINDTDLFWEHIFSSPKKSVLEAIHTSKVIVTENLSQCGDLGSWVKSANVLGYAGLICLPLIHDTKVFGFIEIYTTSSIQLMDNEMELLQELASDLSLGIMKIRGQEASDRIHRALYKMAASVSASNDQAFFHQLTRNMTEALGADGGFIAQINNNDPIRAKTLAAIVDGKQIENIEYDVLNSPCNNLLKSETFILSKTNDCLGPSPTMIHLGMKDYIGHRLVNSNSEVIGMLFVMYKDIPQRTNVILPLLKIFAIRAGNELERLDSDRHIRDQASLLDKAQDAILVRGFLDNKIQYWNNGAERLYGWTRAEATGSSIESLIYPDTSQFNLAMDTLRKTGEWSGEIEQQSKFHEKLIVESHWTLVRDENGNAQSVFTINTDVSDRKAAADKIENLAYYDSLTELPNRILFTNKLNQALISSGSNQKYGALLFLDIDDFKIINDTMGHDVGDLLLRKLAKRLKQCLRTNDTIGRFGGDEFVIIFENLSESEDEAALFTTKIAEKILSSLCQPFSLEKHQYLSTVSIGITLFNNKAVNVKELLKRADLAMYQSKTLGKNTYSFFDPAMQAKITSRVSIESDLRHGLEKNQFLVHYQPQIDSSGRTIGAEALLRWQHPERGMVSPALFIPIAEETKMIVPIGLWVIETACAQLLQWATKPDTFHLTLGVNVSVRQFKQQDFVDQVLRIVDKYKINPEKLKLEITESLFAENVEDLIDKMHKLKSKGIKFSLDDFGTGYSSLSYLKTMPLDQLKIDQSFVRDILDDANDAAIAQSIIGLAKSLGLEVIAEGVETEAQKHFLAKSGCNLYQGYLFSKPLAANYFDEFISCYVN